MDLTELTSIEAHVKRSTVGQLHVMAKLSGRSVSDIVRAVLEQHTNTGSGLEVEEHFNFDDDDTPPKDHKSAKK